MTSFVCEESSIAESFNLKDITSEEVRISENKNYLVTPIVHNCGINMKECFCPAIDLESDAVIAKILQEQFNQEYKEIIKNCKKKFTKKASLFLRGHSYHPEHQKGDGDEDDENEVEDFEKNNLQHSNKIIAKYDIKVNHISENNFNDSKHSNKAESSKPSYTKQEDMLTAEVELDSYTKCQLHRLIKSRILKSVNAVLSTGKESLILHANSDTNASPECVIKVYNTSPVEFKQREICIKSDGYFTNKEEKTLGIYIPNKSETTLRKTTFLWAEKEMHNLLRIHKAGIKCPKPLLLKQHMLVMSFIGEHCHPAPQLKYAQLKTNEYELAYHQIVEAMKTLYHKAGLIHGDLNKCNILWHNNQCYFIDVSQSVEPLSANAYSLLLRDCENITKYFMHKGVKDIQTSRELFMEITDFNYNNKVIMEETINSFKAKYCDVYERDEMLNKDIEAKWQKINRR